MHAKYYMLEPQVPTLQYMLCQVSTKIAELSIADGESTGKHSQKYHLKETESQVYCIPSTQFTTVVSPKHRKEVMVQTTPNPNPPKPNTPKPLKTHPPAPYALPLPCATACTPSPQDSF